MKLSRVVFRAARTCALLMVIALGVVASMPADALANCGGPNWPWPGCKRAATPKMPQAPEAPDSTGAESGVLGLYASILRSLIFTL